jgi:thioredoxin
MAIVNLTKGGFLRKVANYEANPTEWKFLGDKPALIDFYASWCGPCKALSPVLDELAKEFDGKVDIYKVNVDNEKELTSLFRIRSVPTLVFVPMQGDPQVSTGALNRIQLRQALNSLLVS